MSRVHIVSQTLHTEIVVCKQESEQLRYQVKTLTKRLENTPTIKTIKISPKILGIPTFSNCLKCLAKNKYSGVIGIYIGDSQQPIVYEFDYTDPDHFYIRQEKIGQVPHSGELNLHPNQRITIYCISLHCSNCRELIGSDGGRFYDDNGRQIKSHLQKEFDRLCDA